MSKYFLSFKKKKLLWVNWLQNDDDWIVLSACHQSYEDLNAVNVGSLYVDLPLGASQMKIEEVTDYVKALSKFQDC